MDLNDLYSAAREADQRAREQLFEALSVRFRLFAYQRIACDEDAEEVVQDAMLVISEEYQEVEIESSFAAWAYEVLRNRIRNYRRRNRLRQQREYPAGDISDQQQVWRPDPRFEAKLLTCLKRVGDANINYARVLALKYQGFSVDEICQRMNISRNNLYVLLHRARAQLRQCLESGDAI